jgi:transcriptional regulator with XRE-family HTH domain
MLLLVKQARLKAGLSVREAARLAVVQPGAISQVESGERRPWPGLRRRLAVLYGVPECDLFADVDSAHKRLRELGGERIEEKGSDEAPAAR